MCPNWPPTVGARSARSIAIIRAGRPDPWRTIVAVCLPRHILRGARLGDVISLIQVLATTSWHAIKEEHWEYYFGKPQSADHWKPVLLEHPEFFRVENNGDAALKWRWAYERTFDPQRLQHYELSEIRDMPIEEKKKLHREPLTPEQVSTLMNAAIELHARALAQQQESRWWIPIAWSFGGGLLGAILGVLGAIGAALLKKT